MATNRKIFQILKCIYIYKMYIKIRPNFGDNLTDAIKTAEQISKVLKINVEFKFNKELKVIKYKGKHNGKK